MLDARGAARSGTGFLPLEGAAVLSTPWSTAHPFCLPLGAFSSSFQDHSTSLVSCHLCPFNVLHQIAYPTSALALPLRAVDPQSRLPFPCCPGFLYRKEMRSRKQPESSLSFGSFLFPKTLTCLRITIMGGAVWALHPRVGHHSSFAVLKSPTCLDSSSIECKSTNAYTLQLTNCG